MSGYLNFIVFTGDIFRSLFYKDFRNTAEEVWKFSWIRWWQISGCGFSFLKNPSQDFFLPPGSLIADNDKIRGFLPQVLVHIYTPVGQLVPLGSFSDKFWHWKAFPHELNLSDTYIHEYLKLIASNSHISCNYIIIMFSCLPGFYFRYILYFSLRCIIEFLFFET